jgi:threonyl-tRNA synthetase
VFWHPKGWTVWQEVEQYMRRVYRDNGYQEVQAPADPGPRPVGEDRATGSNYRDNMFTTASEKRDYARQADELPRPHPDLQAPASRSYRDLPLRYGEFGSCHRNEPSGALHGIMRVRGFTQDDGHIFCTEDQIQPEVHGLHMRWCSKVYADFGFTDIAVQAGHCGRPAGSVPTRSGTRPRHALHGRL